MEYSLLIIKIGDRVQKGNIIGNVGGNNEIVAEIDGIIRGGLLKEGLYVKDGLK